MFRKTATIAILAASLVTPVLAQKPRTAEKQRQQLAKQQKKSEARLRKFQGLNLTNAQAQQLRSLLRTRNQELKKLRSEQGKERKADLKAAKDQFRSEFRSTLTPEQAAIFDQRGKRKK